MTKPERQLKRIVLPQDKAAIASKEEATTKEQSSTNKDSQSDTTVDVAYVSGMRDGQPIEQMPPELRREALRRLASMPRSCGDRYRKTCFMCGVESAPLATVCDSCEQPLPYTQEERDFAQAMYIDRLTSITAAEAMAIQGLMNHGP